MISVVFVLLLFFVEWLQWDIGVNGGSRLWCVNDHVIEWAVCSKTRFVLNFKRIIAESKNKNMYVFVLSTYDIEWTRENSVIFSFFTSFYGRLPPRRSTCASFALVIHSRRVFELSTNYCYRRRTTLFFGTWLITSANTYDYRTARSDEKYKTEKHNTPCIVYLARLMYYYYFIRRVRAL